MTERDWFTIIINIIISYTRVNVLGQLMCLIKTNLFINEIMQNFTYTVYKTASHILIYKSLGT